MFEADLYEDGGTELLEFDGPEGELEFEFEDEGEFGEEDDFELEGAFGTEGWEVGELEFEDGTRTLLPFHEDFIQKTDTKRKVVHLLLPEGL